MTANDEAKVVGADLESYTDGSGELASLNKSDFKSDLEYANEATNVINKNINEIVNSNTGVGAATTGQMDSDTKAVENAALKNSIDVLNAKQDLLSNRQAIESNAQAMQTQIDMQQYQNNQTADKVGWTGGYVLDQNRQMDYLKATTQAQLYGAMELQKYGYNTALEAARYSYELNLKEYANQYYQQALQNSMEIANMTGWFVSPEVEFENNQFNTAINNVNSLLGEGWADKLDLSTATIGDLDVSNLTTEEKDQVVKALAVTKQVINWYKNTGASPKGVMTWAAATAEVERLNTRINEIYGDYEGLKSEFTEQYPPESGWIYALDKNGNIEGYKEGMTVEEAKKNAINLQNATAKDIYNYIFNEDGTMNEAKRDQVVGYFGSVIEKEESAFQNWLKENANGITMENHNDYASAYIDYINQNPAYIDRINKMLSKFIDDNGVLSYEGAKIFEGFNFSVTDPEGNEIAILEIVKDNNKQKYTKEGYDKNWRDETLQNKATLNRSNNTVKVNGTTYGITTGDSDKIPLNDYEAFTNKMKDLYKDGDKQTNYSNALFNYLQKAKEGTIVMPNYGLQSSGKANDCYILIEGELRRIDKTDEDLRRSISHPDGYTIDDRGDIKETGIQTENTERGAAIGASVGAGAGAIIGTAGLISAIGITNSWNPAGWVALGIGALLMIGGAIAGTTVGTIGGAIADTVADAN